MRYLFNHFAIAAFLAANIAQAKIVDAPTTADALAHVNKDTLLIFDLDNTVIMPTQMLGGEEWFDARVTHLVTHGTKQADAIKQALTEWNAIQTATDVVAVEADAPRLIALHQQAGTKTMGLTARPADLMAVTHKQMAKIKIQLGKSTISSAPFTVKGRDDAPFDTGIVFVGTSNKKGDILAKVLDKLALKPKKIVFVDNKLHHVQDVETALAGRGIEYVGCHLRASDAKIAAFDPEIAAVQFEYFKSILSNDAAAALIKAGFSAK